MSGPRGMTLLEIMVAMFITALLMTFLLTIHIGTMRVRRRTEEVAEMNARARGAFDLLRRDLQGAFPLAGVLPVEDPVAGPIEYGDFDAGAEFRWEAPVDPSDLTRGFRQICFVSAADGARLTLKADDGTGTGTYVDVDPLRHCEHAAVSWCVRGGALFRQTCLLHMSVTSDDAPPNWVFNPPDGGGKGVQVGAGNEAYTDITATFTSVDTFRGMPYIMTEDDEKTSTTSPTSNMYFEMDNDGTMEPVPVNVVLCFPASRDPATLPYWTREFTLLETAGVARTVTAGLVDYRLYSKACPDATVYFGPNEGIVGASTYEMYFVILEPLWWSLGEDAEDLVFRPSYALDPADQLPDGTWMAGVPEYVDVTLVIADRGAPDPAMRSRRFGERIWIPTGGGM